MKLADFENDIFISYAHLDDETPSETQEGWISHFHKCLEFRVSQLFGAKPRIWRDLKLQGNDVFGDEIVDQFPKVAFLISVLSPRYLKSDWCRKEVTAFWKAAEQSGGTRLGNKSRVFKVVKTPVPIEEHPPEIQDTLDYEFFRQDATSGIPTEFDLLMNPDSEKEFWAKLNDLARDITELLQVMERSGTEGPGAAAPDSAAPEKQVYLAETGHDLKGDYDLIKRELEAHNCHVLPDRQLPLVIPDYEREAAEMIASCELSIHLVGQNPGIVPDGGTQSIVEIQNQIAAQQSESGALKRLIWMPSQLQLDNELQERFVNNLRTDRQALAGADLLETPLEDLKTEILKLLAPEPEPPPAPTDSGDDLRHIYMICDQRDVEAVREIDDYLYDQGFEVIKPVFEGDVKTVRKDHEDTLRSCDAVLLYYGAANELWLRAKLREISKIAGQGRSKDFLARLVYVGAPHSDEKERYRTREAIVVKHFETFSPAVLAPFISEVQINRG